jgi:TM2 domain-containing membrane protein YozV
MEQHHHHYYPQPQKSGGTAAILEVLPGFFLSVFGIGHMYAGNVGLGILIMIGWWVVLAINIMLCLVVIGFVTLPLSWLIMLIASPLLAAQSCKQ